MNVQFITENDKPTFAVVPFAEWEKILKRLGEKEKKGDGVLIPNEVVSLYFDKGYSLIKSWRIFLKKTQQEVAEAMGINQSAFSQIESSRKNQRATLNKVAKAIGIDVEQLTFD